MKWVEWAEVVKTVKSVGAWVRRNGEVGQRQVLYS